MLWLYKTADLMAGRSPAGRWKIQPRGSVAAGPGIASPESRAEGEQHWIAVGTGNPVNGAEFARKKLPTAR
jgi:hypothetical protein